MSQTEHSVQDGIPATLQARQALRDCALDYIRRSGLLPPLRMAELAEHCGKVLRQVGMGDEFLNYSAVLFNNALWRDSVAAVPFDRRLLLLPRCLRNVAVCKAAVDELGLNCISCGGCVIGQLRQAAIDLGYVVLVAEGTPVVMSLVASGRIEAIIGVSCLSSLERVFPVIEAASVPGIAIPLLRDGCVNTNVDIEWVWDAVRMAGDDSARRLSMDSMRQYVDGLFDGAGLASVLGPPANETERIAHDWLGRSGKRWRPFLAVCSYQACASGMGVSPMCSTAVPAVHDSTLNKTQEQDAPATHGRDGHATEDDLARIALAVECFHKASLVHDDIEDNDSLRYGQKTLHEQYGVPVALNVGDLLLGEGYRMIAQCTVPPARKEQMLAAAVAAHRCLCAGQGEELLWMRNPRPLGAQAVLDIFSRKTAPAFEVALRLGALLADAGPDVLDMLEPFSQALGVAYQIRDDLEDLSDQGQDLNKMRPSLPLAIAYDRASGADRELIEAVWRRRPADDGQIARLREIFADLGVVDAAQAILATYEQQAVASLGGLRNADLKILLRRVIAKIFGVGDACQRNLR